MNAHSMGSTSIQEWRKSNDTDIHEKLPEVLIRFTYILIPPHKNSDFVIYSQYPTKANGWESLSFTVILPATVKNQPANGYFFKIM